MFRRSWGGEEEIAIRNFLGIAVRLPLTDSVAEKAITVKKKTGLKLPDAVIVATAMDWQAVLLSNDDRIKQVKMVPVQSLLLK